MKKTYDNKFKSRVALEALRGELTIPKSRASIRFIRIRCSDGSSA